MLSMCDSDLERTWLNNLFEQGLRLPDYAQYSVDEAKLGLILSFDEKVAIHIDGAPHDSEQQQLVDDQRRAELERFGWTNMVFHHSEAVEGWNEIIHFNAWLFGGGDNE